MVIVVTWSSVSNLCFTGFQKGLEYNGCVGSILNIRFFYVNKFADFRRITASLL